MRFAIVCLARTGSSHLVDMLDSHPRIRCFGEVLNSTHRGATNEGWIGDSDTPDAVTHLERVLAGRDDATGFKLPINALRDHPDVEGWVRATPELRVLRLRRRNLLALLLSRRMLQVTLVSQSIYGSNGDRTVRIDPSRCLRALTRIEAEDAELDALAGGHPSLQLTFESLNDPAELERAQTFLGVEPRPLQSRYERLRTRSFAETIENWDEITEALHSTRFERFLDESPG